MLLLRSACRFIFQARTTHMRIQFIASLLLVGQLTAQPGAIDQSFNTGTGAGYDVRAVARQADGKILIGGGFSSFNGSTHHLLVRVGPDGGLDPGFADPGPISGNIFCMALQPDGKVLVGGDFSQFGGADRGGVARLNTDGSLDTGFNPGSGLGGNGVFLSDILVQPDGKLVLCGNFTQYNGAAHNCIVRVNADGSSDASFLAGTGFDGIPAQLAAQTDGKILVCGSFDTYNGTTRHGLVRLNPDGGLDGSLDPATGADAGIFSVQPLPSGKILIGGAFTHYDTFPSSHLARVNADGSYDLLFYGMADGPDWDVDKILLQPNDKIIIAGGFTGYNGTSRHGVARLNNEGSLDLSFEPGNGIGSNHVFCAALQPDGKIVLGGDFTTYDWNPAGHIVRVNGGEVIGVEELDGAGAPTVAPNPFSDRCAISFPQRSALRGELLLSDLDGRLLRKLPIRADGTAVVERGALVPGPYLISGSSPAIAFHRVLVVE